MGARGLILVEGLEPRRLLAGVTLITHGYEPLSSNLPGWLDSMANAIVSRAGADTAVYDLRIARNSSDVAQVMSFQHLSGPSPSGSEASNTETVVMLDWADASGIVGSYTSTATIAQLVLPYLTTAFPTIGLAAPLAEVPIHLIGHSRGGSVVSALARDLGLDGVWVDQMTTLDPHPFSPDPAVNVYGNVIFADNYYETNSILPDLKPGGAPVSGAHNVNLTNIDPDHSGIHAYYQGTIDTAATTDGASDGAISIKSSWYGYAGTGPRNDIGFAWSRIGDQARPSDGLLGSAARISDPADVSGSNEWDNIMLAAPSANSVIQGTKITVATGFEDDNNDATVTVGFDTDSNPYDRVMSADEQTFTTASTGERVAEHDVTLDTSGLAPGNYYVFAAIGNGVHTRYDYSLGTITVKAKAPALTGISITGPGQINEDSTIQYKATATYDNGATSDVTNLASWSVDSVAYAHISMGLLTVGSVPSEQILTISCSFGGKIINKFVSVSAPPSGVTITGTAGDDVILVYATKYVFNGITTALPAGIDHIFIDGGSGNDWIDGRYVSIRLQITGAGGNDTIIGGQGNDELSGGNGKDAIWGEAGNDYLLGGGGKDHLYGEAGNDTMSGGGGNDTLVDASGGNYFLGGGGNDVIDARTAPSDGADTVSGGLGYDYAFLDDNDVSAGIEQILA